MKKSFACQNNVSSLSLSCPRQREHARLCWRLRVPELCSLTNQNTAEIHCCSSVHCAHVHEKCLRVPKRWRAVCVPSLPPPSISLALPPSLSPLPPPPLPPSFPLSPNLCFCLCLCGMSCPSWQWHRTGSRWSPVRTLPVAPLWCDLGFFPNSRGNKAAANLRPLSPNERSSNAGRDEGTEGRTKGGSE